MRSNISPIQALCIAMFRQIFAFYQAKYVLCTNILVILYLSLIGLGTFTIINRGVDDYYIIPSAMIFNSFTYISFFMMMHKYRKGWRIRLSMMSEVKKGAILDWLLPPGEVDHRIIELEEGRDRWTAKYGPKRAEWLYVWQSLVTVALFWFDRVVVKFLVRRS